MINTCVADYYNESYNAAHENNERITCCSYNAAFNKRICIVDDTINICICHLDIIIMIDAI